jgi:hypothetical protein
MNGTQLKLPLFLTNLLSQYQCIWILVLYLGSWGWIHGNCARNSNTSTKEGAKFQSSAMRSRSYNQTDRKWHRKHVHHVFMRYHESKLGRHIGYYEVLRNFSRDNTWMIPQNRHNLLLFIHFHVTITLAFQSAANNLCFWRSVANCPMNGSTPIVALLRSCRAADRWIMRPSKEKWKSSGQFAPQHV